MGWRWGTLRVNGETHVKTLPSRIPLEMRAVNIWKWVCVLIDSNANVFFPVVNLGGGSRQFPKARLLQRVQRSALQIGWNWNPLKS